MIDLEDYKRRGYAVVPGLLPGEEMDALRAEAREVFRLQMERRGLAGVDPSESEFEAALYRFFADDVAGFVACSQQVQHLVSLNRLGSDPRVLAGLQALGFGFPGICTRPLMLFNSRHLAKREVYWRLPVHQDWRNMQGSLDSVVVWIPLIDVDREIGALEVLPGSHKRGLLEARVTDGYPEIESSFADEDFVACEMRKGDALFFSAFLLHRSGTNATERVRWSIQLRYNNLHERTFLERGFPSGYTYKPKEELITPGFPAPGQLDELFR